MSSAFSLSRATILGLKLLAYEALSYLCMRPSAASVGGLELLADEISGLKLLVYEALSC